MAPEGERSFVVRASPDGGRPWGYVNAWPTSEFERCWGMGGKAGGLSITARQATTMGSWQVGAKNSIKIHKGAQHNTKTMMKHVE